MSRELPKKFYALLLFVLLVANISLYRTVFAPHTLTASTLAVGKGNATLVQTPNNAIILIDTGPDASILRALGERLPPWQRTIDLVILTSTKKSVTGGLPDVLSRYKVMNQITITESRRIIFSDGSSIDIVVSPNATTTVSVN